MVFHEIVSSDVHLDLYVVPPQPGEASVMFPHGRDFYTIVTSGMSTQAMKAPASGGGDIQGQRYAELMICLPSDWPGLYPTGTFDLETMRDEGQLGGRYGG